MNTMFNSAKVMFFLVLFTLIPVCHLQAQDEVVSKDEEVRLVGWEELKYPPTARIARIQGVVVVRVRLDDKGKVVESTAISGAKELIGDAVDNARKWRFAPNATKTAVIVYQFTIENGFCHDYESSHFVVRPPNFASILACDRPGQP